MKPGYRILEHPSDAGIEVWGRDLNDVFSKAAVALISLIAYPEEIESRESRVVSIEAPDRESLLVKLLSRILYFYDGEQFLTSRLDIRALSETYCEVSVEGEPYDPEKHRVKMDVKAVTYHQLSVENSADGIRATVFVDL